MTDKEYQDTMLDLFGHQGWTLLTENLEADLEALNQIGAVKDEKELYTRQGMATVLTTILMLPHFIKGEESDAV